MPTIYRHQRLVFLKTANDKYELFGEGVTDMTVAGNAKTAEKQYVHQQNAAGGLSGYAPTMSITAEAQDTDPALLYIMDLGKTWDIGAKAHTDVVSVDLFAGTKDSRPAVQQPIVISIDNPGSGPAGEALAVTATLTYDGSAVIGTWNETTKTFTAGVVPANLAVK